MKETLIVDKVQYSYSKERIFQFPSIACSEGDHLLILGASGCGKTTLLHLMAGLMQPQSGRIQIKDQDITQLKGATLDRFRGKEIGLIFQIPHFIKSLTAKENLAIAASLNNHSIDKDYLEELFDSLNIKHCQNSKVTQMSQGELQRLSIARAVINKPSLILADEPTSSLDDKNCLEAINLLRHQAEKLKANLLIVTHDNRLTSIFSKQVHLK